MWRRACLQKPGGCSEPAITEGRSFDSNQKELNTHRACLVLMQGVFGGIHMLCVLVLQVSDGYIPQRSG